MHILLKYCAEKQRKVLYFVNRLALHRQLENEITELPEDMRQFRMFRGTLKVNTIIATLELVNIVCDLAVKFSDDEISKLSWTDFVLSIPDSEYPELVMYLKERRLYVNEPVEDESEEV